MLAPIAVWAWQVLGAGITFRRVQGQPFSVVSWVISIAFVALVANAGDALVNPALFTLACLCLVAALVLFEWARRTIRGQFFSWIFSADTPAFLCTTGPYAFVRNPFYTSYLLTMAAAVVIVPDILRAAVFVGMVVYFLMAALHEEKKFARSGLTEEYARYKERTGRFFPKISAKR
jgi:protein-S-isoprenylcysteine O-methyltransferase Ste14